MKGLIEISVSFLLVVSCYEAICAQEVPLRDHVRNVEQCHNYFFGQFSIISAGVDELERCSASGETEYSCDFEQIANAQHAIGFILKRKIEMMGSLDWIIEYLNVNQKFTQSDRKKVKDLLVKIIECAEKNQDKSMFFARMIGPYRKRLKGLRATFGAPSLAESIVSIKEFYELDRDFMSFSFLQYEMLAEIMGIGVNRLKGGVAKELFSDMKRVAEKLLSTGREMEDMFYRLLGKSCLSCSADIVWGYDYAEKINHTEIESYLLTLERQTNHRWFLPTAGNLESIKSAFIKRNMNRYGNGYFICLPGLCGDAMPVLEFDNRLGSAIYNSFGASAIIPVRCKESDFER